MIEQAAQSQPIRPMNLAQLLDRAIGVYRRNFFKFIGIIAIPYIPLMLIQIGLAYFVTSSVPSAMGSHPSGGSINTANILLGYLGMFIVIIADFFLVQGFGTAVLTRAVSDSYTGQEETGILGAYQKLGQFWLRVLLTLLFMVLVFLGAYVWTLVPCIGWLSGAGVLFFISAAVLPLVSPVVVLENLDAIESVRRAWNLARSRFWWMIGCAVVLALFGLLISFGPMILITIVLRAIVNFYPSVLGQEQLISTITQNLATMFLGLLYFPVKTSIMTVVYFDLRARSEGLDLALQIADAAPTATAAIQLPEISAESKEPLFTREDLGRFILLTLGIVGVYVIFFVVIFAFVFATLPRP